MAHPNLNERREAVRIALRQQGELDGALMRELAEQFGCSHGAIRADVLHLRHYNGQTYHVSPKMRRHIRNRDRDICAYCGQKIDKPIIEHVVPVSMGGKATEDNLVVACQSCNTKKRDQIWTPIYDNR